MRLFIPILLSLSCACASIPRREPAQSDVTRLSQAEIDGYAQAVADLLRPRLFRLDRSALTFYYEEAPPASSIASIDDATRRIMTKPNRFEGMKMGLYSEADPKGSRQFGKEHPRLFVFEIAAGTLIWSDLHPTEAERESLIRILHLDPTTREQYSVIHYVGHMMVDERDRAEIEERVVSRLGAENKLYHFNEAAKTQCRFEDTDLALELKEPQAVRILAYYSDSELVETYPLSAYIKRLFDETRFLNGSGAPPLPRKIVLTGKMTARSIRDYLEWKQRYILGCGPRWSFE